MTPEIRTADANDLWDLERAARGAARRAARVDGVLPYVLRAFVERGGPVEVDAIVAAFPDRPRDDVLDTILVLDGRDLIHLRDGRVEVAYPFSAAPTDFTVTLADGRERYACCAIDALGIAAMLGGRVRILARCHHCRAPLDFAVAAAGPGTDASGIMVWVGRRATGERRLTASL